MTCRMAFVAFALLLPGARPACGQAAFRSLTSIAVIVDNQSALRFDTAGVRAVVESELKKAGIHVEDYPPRDPNVTGVARVDLTGRQTHSLLRLQTGVAWHVQLSLRRRVVAIPISGQPAVLASVWEAPGSISFAGSQSEADDAIRAAATIQARALASAFLKALATPGSVGSPVSGG